MGYIIAVFNQAGGVAKTTLTRDLGYELTTRGKKMLLIDADSQGSLGDFLGLNPHERPKEETFWGNLEKPIIASAFNLDVGLSNLSLISIEKELADRNDNQVFLDSVEKFTDMYDYIIVDCPPSISQISIQVLVAADGILIPVQTEQKSYMGLVMVQNEILAANSRRRRIKPPLQIAGVVPTIYNPNRKIHSFYLGEIIKFANDRLKSPVLNPIRDLIAVTEASNSGLPLKLHSPNSPGNEDITKIADQILEIVNGKREAANG